MTTIAVDGTGYLAAVERLRGADRVAAAQCLALGRVVQGHDAMIGGPTLVGPLAAAYDRAAGRALVARTTLTEVLTGLGTALAASLTNHTRAELASRVGQVHVLDPGDVVGADARGWDEVGAPPGPPSSLGGTDLDLPGWAREVLDRVQGFVWPDADVGRLRLAASAWRRSGDGLPLVGDGVTGAAASLEVERTPDVPLAQDALHRLDVRLHVLAADHHEIGVVLDRYADLVDERRREILALVEEVKARAAALRDEALHPGLSGLLVPPLRVYRMGEAAFGGVDAVAQAAPRFLGYVDRLRAEAADLARTLEGVSANLDRLDRGLFFADPRHQFGPTDGQPDPWLRSHEGGKAKGHTIERHVGKTDAELRARFSNPRVRRSSTYDDETTAGKAIRAALAAHRADISSWLASDAPKMKPIHFDTGSAVGRVIPRGGLARHTTMLVVVAVRDESMPHNYRILTSYPEVRQ